MSCSSTGVSISSRLGECSTLPVKFSWSASSHAGTATTFSTASTIGSRFRLFSFTVITSPCLRMAEGMLCLRPARREAHPVDYVVHPELHDPQQVLAANPLHPCRPVIGSPELFLGDSV